MTWRPTRTVNQPLLAAHQEPSPRGHFRTAALLLMYGQPPWSLHSRGVSTTWAGSERDIRALQKPVGEYWIRRPTSYEPRTSRALRAPENVIVRHENKYEWLEDHLIRRLMDSGIEDNAARALAHELQHDILVGFGVIDRRNASQDQLELDLAREVSEGGHNA